MWVNASFACLPLSWMVKLRSSIHHLRFFWQTARTAARVMPVQKSRFLQWQRVMIFVAMTIIKGVVAGALRCKPVLDLSD